MTDHYLTLTFDLRRACCRRVPKVKSDLFAGQSDPDARSLARLRCCWWGYLRSQYAGKDGEWKLVTDI